MASDTLLLSSWRQSIATLVLLANAKILHDGSYELAVGLDVKILILYLVNNVLQIFGKSQWLGKYKAGLAYLLLSLPIATLTVSLFNPFTSEDCPWSVVDFGGQQPYQSWFYSLWSPLSDSGHCFPSGHASSAHMFFGLYFFSGYYWPTKSSMILTLVIIIGLKFGFDQPIGGAHYISHDLTVALICWFIWHIRVNTWIK